MYKNKKSKNLQPMSRILTLQNKNKMVKKHMIFEDLEAEVIKIWLLHRLQKQNGEEAYDFWGFESGSNKNLTAS